MDGSEQYLEFKPVSLFVNWLWRVRPRAKAKEAKETAQSVRVCNCKSMMI